MLTYAYCVVTSYLMTLKQEEGQGMVEYGLLLGLIAAGVIAVLLHRAAPDAPLGGWIPTTASLQGVLILLMAGLAGVPYSLSLFLTVLGELVLLAFTLTAFGVMTAARIQQFQAYMALNQMLLMPLFFLSGALFPLHGLPTWLHVLTRIDPITYAVDPVRRAVFAHLNVPASTQHVLNPGVTWGSWRVPTAVELLIVAGMGITMLLIAIWEFRKAD